MIILLSPAKSLDFKQKAPFQKYSQAYFQKEPLELIERLKTLSQNDIADLMQISDKLAELNYERYQNWQSVTNLDNAKQAAYAFQGDVYQGLQIDKLNEQDVEFAQKHLRILSGMYGLLKPLDLIQPYRLEMGTSLNFKTYKNLYEFWGVKITELINEELKNHKDKTVINLASQEYFKAVKMNKLDGQVITPLFKELRGDTYKVISFFAKKARGLMAAYLIKNRLTEPEVVKAFATEGYAYHEDLSKKNNWLFSRVPQS